MVIAFIGLASQFCQTPSIPRKGTETSRLSKNALAIENLSDTLNSPQGDGNSVALKVTALSLPRSDTLNSPQGDGNEAKPMKFQLSITCESDTLNSPQGDGNLSSFTKHSAHGGRSVRHPQFPARGRKLPNNFDQLGNTPQSDTLNSPQGDGTP